MRTFFDNVKNKIDRAEVISFDVFDTLLLRPYIEPTDLFDHLERLAEAPFFAVARRYAEKQAQRKNPQLEDITYDDIYNEMPPCFSSMKEKELQFEKQVLQANPEILQVFNYAKASGKRIIIVSDMYLSATFLDSVLEKNGYIGYEKIYMSSEYGKTKASGNLYHVILEDLNLKGKEIVHIGDNRKSDIKRARRAGIQAVWYKQVVRQYIDSNVRIRQFLKHVDKDYHFDVSILVALLAWRRQKIKLGLIQPSYWENLGYEYAGPLAYGFCRFIERKAAEHNIDHLLFVARDGYTLQKVFQIFNETVKTSYIYASRYIKWVYLLDYYFAWRKDTPAEVVIKHYCNKNAKLQQFWESRDREQTPESFIENYKDVFEQLANSEVENYRSYLEKEIQTSNSLGVVDSWTTSFTAQTVIETVLKCETLGFYFQKTPKMLGWMCAHECMQSEGGNPNKSIRIDSDFFEFLWSAPELSVKEFSASGEPIYDDDVPAVEKENRGTIYREVSEGAVLFAEEVTHIFGGDLFFQFRTLKQLYHGVIDFPTAMDRTQLSKILVPTVKGDRDLRRGLRFRLPFHTRIRPWFEKLPLALRVPIYNLLLILYKPIHIGIRGRRKSTERHRSIEIGLLPCLGRCYFRMELKIGITISFRIGNVNDV